MLVLCRRTMMPYSAPHGESEFWATPGRKERLVELLAAGLTYREVGRKLGISRDAVDKKAWRMGLRCKLPSLRKAAIVERPPMREPGHLEPLPPGHPITWGAISTEAWPYATT
jgi:hypothetical protein